MRVVQDSAHVLNRTCSPRHMRAPRTRCLSDIQCMFDRSSKIYNDFQQNMLAIERMLELGNITISEHSNKIS